MAIVDEKKKKSQEEGLLGRVYGDQPAAPVQPAPAPVAAPTLTNPDSFLMKRVFDNRAQAAPTATAQPIAAPPSREAPVYNLYNPGGPEARAGKNLATATFGPQETVQERFDRNRRASSGHKDYMEGFRKPDPSSMPGPSSDFNVDSMPAQPARSLLGTLAAAPQEGWDTKRRASRGHGDYMAKRAGVTGVHPEPTEILNDPISSTFGNFVNGDTGPSVRPSPAGAALAADYTSNTLAGSVNNGEQPSVTDIARKKLGSPPVSADNPMYVVGGNSPAATKTAGRNGMPGLNAFAPSLSPADQALKGNLGKINERIASGAETPTAQQAQQIQALREQAGFLRGGTDRRAVGPDGLPIRTSGSGLENPNDPASIAARTKQKEQFDARMGVVKAPVPGEMLTRENSPGMKDPERIAYNNVILQGRNQLNNTNAQNVGVAEERAVETEGKKLSLGSAKKITDLQDKYLAETDPVKKKAIEREYLTLTGKAQPKFQIAAQESVDPVTQMPIKRSFAVNPDNPSESFEIGGTGDGQAQAPPPKEQLKKGQVVNTAKGKMRWTGTGFVPAT